MYRPPLPDLRIRCLRAWSFSAGQPAVRWATHPHASRQADEVGLVLQAQPRVHVVVHRKDGVVQALGVEGQHLFSCALPRHS